MSAGGDDGEWNPEPATLREGQAPDEAHARRVAAVKEWLEEQQDDADADP